MSIPTFETRNGVLYKIIEVTPFKTMDDVKAANHTIGHHWFSADTMRFFKTKIVTELIKGKYFVTSEVDPQGTKAFSVRIAKPDGQIGTIGEFHSHPTKAAALAVIKTLD